MSTLLKIWNSRKAILEGVTNTVFKKQFVEDVVKHRQKICDGCKHYGGKCAVPGTGPCCGACGCSMEFKLRALSAVCGLADIGETPLWFPVLKQDQADKLEEEIAKNA